MKHVALIFLFAVQSASVFAAETQWVLKSTATFKIQGRENSGARRLEVTAIQNERASVEETLFLGSQVKVCRHTVKIKNNQTESTTCTGQIPNYLATEFYPKNSVFYIGQEKPTLKLKVGTFKAICKTYRVGDPTGQAFAVACSSDEIPFWGELATAVSDPTGSRDIMYSELVELK